MDKEVLTIIADLKLVERSLKMLNIFSPNEEIGEI